MVMVIHERLWFGSLLGIYNQSGFPLGHKCYLRLGLLLAQTQGPVNPLIQRFSDFGMDWNHLEDLKYRLIGHILTVSDRENME